MSRPLSPTADPLTLRQNSSARIKTLVLVSFLLLIRSEYALVHRMDTPLNSVSPILDAPLQSEATDGFTDVSVARLATMSPETLNNLPYGVIGTAPDGTVEVYNAAESRLAGLSANRVLGQHLFTVVAPCMNNYLVAQRFEDEVELDVVVPYVLTLRMRPTPVKLRLLRTPDQSRRFLLIQR